MSGKRKYSYELKLEVVQRYLEGNIGLRKLAKEYCIGSKTCIEKWVAYYREHGEKGLCTTN